MRNKILAAGLFMSLATTAGADEPPTFEDYLDEMNWTSVSFSGFIYYDQGATGSNFGFLQEEGRAIFGAVVDAGRQHREHIETECQSNSFSVDRNRICRIEGSGSVEIRNSRLFLSIEHITSLEPPAR